MAATYVLGINAYHGDVAAVLLRDGQLVAAVEEERFRRVKHWAGFPTMAIQSVLGMAGIRGSDVHHVAISRDPKANLLRKEAGLSNEQKLEVLVPNFSAEGNGLHADKTSAPAAAKS